MPPSNPHLGAPVGSYPRPVYPNTVYPVTIPPTVTPTRPPGGPPLGPGHPSHPLSTSQVSLEHLVMHLGLIM